MYQLTNKPWILASLALALLMLTACAGGWQTAREGLNGSQWSLSTPDGWMHLSMPDSDMLSKDGPYLEYILVQARPLTQPFRFTRQRLSATMLPHEAAEFIVDNLRADPLIRGFRHQASEPAMIDGHPGFKLTYSYLDKHGVELKTVYYGVVLPDYFFNLRYTAARRYYFDKEQAAFNQVLDSLELPSGQPALSSARQLLGNGQAPEHCGLNDLACSHRYETSLLQPK
jgi:hypothetical protein